MLSSILLTIGGLYLILCIFLYWNQERLIFKPTTLPSEYVFSDYSNIEELYFPIEDGQIHALHFKTDRPRGIILYFHGNSQALESWGYAAEDFTKHGFEVLMPDYRTYGKSTGKLSEQGLYDDAMLLYNFIKKSWSSSNIILYGRSLGTGIATELATIISPKLLILETPYTSMPAMANKIVPFIPVKWLMKYQFRNITKMKKLKCPIHIFGATMDELTPFQHAVALNKKTANPSENLTAVEGAGHNNIGDFPLYHKKIEMLLEKI